MFYILETREWIWAVNHHDNQFSVVTSSSFLELLFKTGGFPSVSLEGVLFGLSSPWGLGFCGDVCEHRIRFFPLSGPGLYLLVPIGFSPSALVYGLKHGESSLQSLPFLSGYLPALSLLVWELLTLLSGIHWKYLAVLTIYSGREICQMKSLFFLFWLYNFFPL